MVSDRFLKLYLSGRNSDGRKERKKNVAAQRESNQWFKARQVADPILTWWWRRTRSEGGLGLGRGVEDPITSTLLPLSVNRCLATGFILAGLQAAVCCLWPYPGIRLLLSIRVKPVLALDAAVAIQGWILQGLLMKASISQEWRSILSQNMTQIHKAELGMYQEFLANSIMTICYHLAQLTTPWTSGYIPNSLGTISSRGSSPTSRVSFSLLYWSCHLSLMHSVTMWLNCYSGEKRLKRIDCYYASGQSLK